MGKGLFITGTGTDVGKTLISALIVKKLHEGGAKSGYYKAALSGVTSMDHSDAGYVKQISRIEQEVLEMVSYWYNPSVSPHLAAKMCGNPLELKKVEEDYKNLLQKFDFLTVEGSGGIICPLRWDENEKIFLHQMIKLLDLSCLIVADSGLGTINSTVLTVQFLQKQEILVKGIILNRWEGNVMQEDNKAMIQEITKIPVVATVKNGDQDLKMDLAELQGLYNG